MKVTRSPTWPMTTRPPSALLGEAAQAASRQAPRRLCCRREHDIGQLNETALNSRLWAGERSRGSTAIGNNPETGPSDTSPMLANPALSVRSARRDCSAKRENTGRSAMSQSLSSEGHQGVDVPRAAAALSGNRRSRARPGGRCSRPQRVTGRRSESMRRRFTTER